MVFFSISYGYWFFQSLLKLTEFLLSVTTSKGRFFFRSSNSCILNFHAEVLWIRKMVLRTVFKPENASSTQSSREIILKWMLRKPVGLMDCDDGNPVRIGSLMNGIWMDCLVGNTKRSVSYSTGYFFDWRDWSGGFWYT